MANCGLLLTNGDSALLTSGDLLTLTSDCSAQPVAVTRTATHREQTTARYRETTLATHQEQTLTRYREN